MILGGLARLILWLDSATMRICESRVFFMEETWKCQMPRESLLPATTVDQLELNGVVIFEPVTMASGCF
jgi:hypothetical protein